MTDIHDLDPLDRLDYRIEMKLIDKDPDPEVKEWVNRQLRQYSALVRRVTGPEAYQDFVLTYVRRERTKLQESADSDRNPYDENRERPLCTCGLECAIQEAREPIEFKQYDSIDAAIRAFKRTHPGHPLVLDEARDAWATQEGDLKLLYRRLLTALVNNEIPDWDDEDELLQSLKERREDVEDETDVTKNDPLESDKYVSV